MKKKLCFVVSAYGTATAFLKDHIKALSAYFDIYLVANLGGDKVEPIDGVKENKDIALQRGISITADFNAVRQLTRYFRQEKFDVVHSVTPKAGLVTAIAGRLAGISVRIHIFTGQVWVTRKGAMRRLLKSIDMLIANCDNHILVDGESQRQFLISEGVVSAQNSRVLGAGSICGANTTRFTPSDDERRRQRKTLGISDEKVVFSFMGRLNRDKGIYELISAFNGLIPIAPNAYLLIFGTDEEDCMSHLSEYSNIKPKENFLYYGPTSTPQLSLQAADVFCLPSYREGFGMSVVEASCLGLPVICSDAYGLADTMVDNQTGIRCKVADVDSLRDAMQYFYDCPQERQRMGKAGRNRVLDLFPGEKIVDAWVNFYKKILEKL